MEKTTKKGEKLNDDSDSQLYQYDSDEDEGQIAQNTYTGNNRGLHTVSFKDFLLTEQLNKAISDAGYEAPSEVQSECIPQAILGTDILCQAKSGMGKTSVYIISILQQIAQTNASAVVSDGKSMEPVALVLVPTRELAIQTQKLFKFFAKYVKDVDVECCVGGEWTQPKGGIVVVVGTPGKVKMGIQHGWLVTKGIKFFVVDECDKMLGDVDMRGDVQKIFIKTQYEKQVMMFSATIKKDIAAICRKFLQKQVEVIIDDEKLVLDGLVMYYLDVKEQEKTKKLVDLLDALKFDQVMVYVSSVQRAKILGQILREQGFPAMEMHAKMKQTERRQKYELFKQNKQKIVVATEIFGRGVDFEHVNVVFNYDMPFSSDSYLHRVGRAGRFGTKGLAISFVANPEDQKSLADVQKRFIIQINPLPDAIDTSTYCKQLLFYKIFKCEQLV